MCSNSYCILYVYVQAFILKVNHNNQSKAKYIVPKVYYPSTNHFYTCKYMSKIYNNSIC